MNKEFNWIVTVVTTSTVTNTDTGTTLTVPITTSSTNMDIIKEEERKGTLAYVIFMWNETNITYFQLIY
jgi:hypothetical protein